MGLDFKIVPPPLKVIIASEYIMERRYPTMDPKIISWIDTWMMRQSYTKMLAMFMGWKAAKKFLESGIVPGGGNA